MKKITLIALCAVLLAPNVSAAQVPRFIDQLIDIAPQRERATTTATTTPQPDPATSTPATSTPSPNTPEPTPKPNPTPDEATSTPATPEPPAPPPAPTEPTTPATPTGTSADPNVLAAQNSEPTAGAGNVYRGNMLPAPLTYFLLTAACALGMVGIRLSAYRPVPTFVVRPVPSA